MRTGSTGRQPSCLWGPTLFFVFNRRCSMTSITRRRWLASALYAIGQQHLEDNKGRRRIRVQRSVAVSAAGGTMAMGVDGVSHGLASMGIACRRFATGTPNAGKNACPFRRNKLVDRPSRDSFRPGLGLWMEGLQDHGERGAVVQGGSDLNAAVHFGDQHAAQGQT